MIISEKQILSLINIAHFYAAMAADQGIIEYSQQTQNLINEIQGQQSNELKEIEGET